MNVTTSRHRIPRATLASAVIERVKDSVLSGAIVPGTQLNEVELANDYGVSRGPVREALQRLVQEGLLVSEPHRGVFVPVLTEADIRDVYVTREALEFAAVRLILNRGLEAEASRELSRHVASMVAAEASGDWESVGQHDLAFHVALVHLSGSTRLHRMFSTVISETRMCLGVLTEAKARADLVDEHRHIAELIAAGMRDEALNALSKHFDEAIVTLLDRVPQQPTEELER